MPSNERATVPYQSFRSPFLSVHILTHYTLSMPTFSHTTLYLCQHSHTLRSVYANRSSKTICFFAACEINVNRFAKGTTSRNVRFFFQLSLLQWDMVLFRNPVTNSFLPEAPGLQWERNLCIGFNGNSQILNGLQWTLEGHNSKHCTYHLLQI